MGGNPWCNMGKCNVSICEQERGAVRGVAEGLGVIWASVFCPSVNIIGIVYGRTITGVTE